jgi:mannose-1-phosphate guanylyltransferase
MVLAAGHGTRLRPLSEERPKPLAPVGDRPALLHVLERLQAFGAAPIAVNAHEQPDAFVPVLPADVTLLHEPELLGTAGGVANARMALGEGDAIVWNGDILAEVDLAALAATAGLAALAIGDMGPRDSGTVGLDAGGRVVRLRGQRFGEETAGAEFTGIQRLSAEARARLPKTGCLVGDLYLPALATGLTIAAVPVVRRWRDIGSLAGYLAANLDWLGDRAGWSAPTASVAPGVRLRQALVGADARVSGTGELARVVVWPGAVARAPLADAIVLGSGRVVPVGSTEGGAARS